MQESPFSSSEESGFSTIKPLLFDGTEKNCNFATKNPITILMKKLKCILMAAALLVALPVSAQFRAGIRIGTEVNSMHWDKSVFDNSNRAGFTGGVMAEFNIPVINLGFDAALMYVHRVNKSSIDASDAANDPNAADMVATGSFKNRDYIEIPINFKYKIGLPLVGKFVTPYVLTGPSFSFLVSKKAINEAYKNKAVDVAWNFGLGVEVLSHLQVSASYGLGMTKAVKVVNSSAKPIDGKNNYWTITAAWLF